MSIGKTSVLLLIAITVGLWSANKWLATETVVMNDTARQDAPGDFIKLSDGITHYRLSGPDSGEAVVLVAGATLPMWVWKDLDKRLAESGYQVLVYDMFGRGYSDRPDTVYDVEFHYKQLRELIDRTMPEKKVHLINLALGALFSSEYIIRHPQKVRSMITIGPDGFGVKKKVSTRILLNMPSFMRAYVFSTFGSSPLMSRLDSYSRDREVIQKLKMLYKPTLNYIGFKRAVVSSVLNMPINNAQPLYSKVNKTQVPVLFVWGENDLVTPFPGKTAVSNVLPDANIKILEGLGHLPQFEDMGLVQRLIEEFISTTSRRP